MSAVELPRRMQIISPGDVTCVSLLSAGALATMDALCCPFLCCCCGGCCGKLLPFTSLLDPRMQTQVANKSERCYTTCFAQTAIATVLPLTLCACGWGCCGLCAPVIRTAFGGATVVPTGGAAPMQLPATQAMVRVSS